MSEVNCVSEPCPLFLNSTCVFYTGESLLYIGVQTNDNLEIVIEKINQAFQNAGIGYAFTNGLIQPTPFQPVQLGGALIQNTTIGGNFTLTFSGNVQAAKHITTGGSSSQFVKGDGTLDPTTYQPAANYITGLSGDATASGPGVAAMTLATVNFASGTFGNGNTIPIVTVNAKGLVTNITPTPINLPPISLTFVGDVVGSGLTGSNITLLLQNVNANPYTTITPLKFTVNGKGLVTSASPITASDIVNILGYNPGTSGTSGSTGTSGTSGTTGTSGTSGTSATSGTSGTTGTSGTSATSGTSGTSGTDGTGGTSGTSGSTGTSGTAGTSGTSATSGTSGTTGSSGTSGTSGSTGTSGSSGTTGTSGSSGTTGTSGSSGTSGTTGTSGTSGTSGSTGTSGSSGLSGDRFKTTSTTTYTLQAPGNPGTLTVDPGLAYTVAQSIIIAYDANNHNEAEVTSYNSITGVINFVTFTLTGSGTYSSWFVNIDGASGGDGSSGSSGTSGTSATAGTSGTTGTSGSSGTSGTTGTSGSSGTSGTSATNGTGGTSGTSGSSATSGTSGSSATSGTTGTSGTSATSGTSGTSATSGTTGTSGTSGGTGTGGTSGTSGSSATSGTSGTSGTSVAVSGSTNTLAKFTSATTIGNSIVTDNGSLVSIGGALTATGNITGAYILGSYFNASAGNSENPTIGQIWTQNTSDNYLRKSTPAHFRSQITDGVYVPISGGINMTGSFGLNDSKLYLRTNGDNNHYLWNAGDDWEELNAYEGTGFRVTSNGGATGLLYVYGSTSGGYTYSPYSFRAPIFYDSNNTGYYLDPSSTSSLRTVGSWRSDSAAWDGEFNGKIQYHSNHWYIQAADLLIYRNSAGSNVFTVNQSGELTATGNVRSPIFYDSNNTAYYLDPASGSRINAINYDNLYFSGDATYGFLGRNVYADTVNGRGADPLELNYYDGGSVIIGTGATGSKALYAGSLFSAGNAVITTGNIGSQTVANTTSISSATGGSYNWTAENYFRSNMNTTSASPPLQAYSNNGSGAIMSFHRGGYYAVNFGLDSDNVMRIGGWSAGANLWQLDMSGNNYALTSSRAPIFYDSNNTGYYLDPASTSNLNLIQTQGIRNDGSVADDDGFGISWDSSAPNAYGIYREAGAWSPPFPDLRIAFHTGIKLGANASYQGIRFYDDYTMVNEVMSVNNGSSPIGASHVYVNNVLQAGSSLRAPIFYDSNNTGYYLDPASGSYLNGVSTTNYLTASNCNLAVTGIAGQITLTTSTGFGGYFRATEHIVIENTTAGYHVYVIGSNGVGVVKYYNDQFWSAQSDGRIKTVHSTLENNLSKLENINPIYYSFNNFDDDKNRIGLIAQEVQEHFPELVNIDPKTDYLTVNYTGLIPVLLGAIKELKNKVETLETKIQ
jgi:hypothetical protein